MLVYIYTLVDPNTRHIRYVGITKNAEKRLRRHYHEKTRNPQKWQWLNQLKDNGQEPIMRVLCGLSTYGRAEFLERKLVNSLLDQGEPLLNIKYTDEFQVIQEKSRQKMIEAWRWRKRRKTIKLSEDGNSWV